VYVVANPRFQRQDGRFCNKIVLARDLYIRLDMDIPRKSRKVRRIVIRVVVAIVALVAIAVITLVLYRLEPAAPSVERQTLLIDGVKQGDIILEVRGVGTLVSEDRLIVPSRVSGRAFRILIQAGTPVEPNTVILELSNPQLELNWKDAQTQLNSAQAQYDVAKARLLKSANRVRSRYCTNQS